MAGKVFKDLTLEIEQLLQRGKSQGYINYEEIETLFNEGTVWSPFLEDFFAKVEESNLELHDNGKIDKPTLELSDAKELPDALILYLRQIHKIPLLTVEEERRLARMIENINLRTYKIEHKLGVSLKRLKNLYNDWIQAKVEQKDFPAILQKFLDNEIHILIKTITDMEEKVEYLQNKFVEANLRLVVEIAYRYTTKEGGVPLLDLIEEGNMGLIRAVKRFDYKQGYRFSTYATWWIKQALRRAIAGQTHILKVPVYIHAMINKYGRIINALAQELNREPTLEEVSKRMNLSIPKIIKIINVAQKPLSLETPIGEDGVEQLSDLIRDKNESLSPIKIVFLRLLREQIAEILKHLSEKERSVIRLRFGLDGLHPHSLKEVGTLFGVSRQRIQQIEIHALNNLKKMKISRDLYDWLEPDIEYE